MVRKSGAWFILIFFLVLISVAQAFGSEQPPVSDDFPPLDFGSPAFGGTLDSGITVAAIDDQEKDPDEKDKDGEKDKKDDEADEPDDDADDDVTPPDDPVPPDDAVSPDDPPPPDDDEVVPPDEEPVPPDDDAPPPNDDPPPPDDDPGPGPPDDEDKEKANYHVHVTNQSGAERLFQFSIESRDYDHSMTIPAGSDAVSATYPAKPGYCILYARWQTPGAADWFYTQQARLIEKDESQEFDFTLDPIYLHVEGRIVDDGGPVDGATVDLFASGESEPRDTERTGEDGEFEFHRVENGESYFLKINREGYLEATRELGVITMDFHIGDIAITLEGSNDPVDTDGDGVADDVDAFPSDPGETVDTDHDGTGNNADAFPEDPGETVDTDHDGTGNNADAFPEDPGETVDTDHDGIGNNADTDDDDDGMPDEWELQYGLDPLIDDAAGDPDSDGISNAEEYAAGTDPTVHEENPGPDRPLLRSPAAGTSGTSIAVLLETAVFSDPDGDGHATSRWQISTVPDFSSLVFDRVTDSHLTRVEVPNLVLLGETAYFWRVQFTDIRGGVSEWSEISDFTTGPWAADADGDGISDAFAFREFSDLDGDGNADLDQANMRCILSCAGNGRYMGIQCTGTGEGIEGLESVDPAVITEQEGKPGNMPFGLIGFRVGITPGETLQLRIWFSEPVKNPAGWYRYDPLAGWSDDSKYAVLGNDGRSIDINIVDGGPGDADGVANGIIVDPGGIAVEAATVLDDDDDDDDDDDGGWYLSCFIDCLWRSFHQ